MCHNSIACHAYVMWEELGHSHLLYVLAVSNIVTTGNGHKTLFLMEPCSSACV